MAIKNYETEVLADGPIGYWRLGETPGSTTAADSSGNGNNGDYSGGITLGQPGFHGGDTAARFDGATGRIDVPNRATLNPPIITIEAKVSWSGPNPGPISYGQRILEKSSYSTRAQYSLLIIEGGHVEAEFRTINYSVPTVDVNVIATTIAVVPQGVETHIVATYDGQKIQIYFNGILVNETTTSSDVRHIDVAKMLQPPSPELNLGIGNQSPRDRPFYGIIDEVALFDKALSADRIRAHYQAQFKEAEGFQYAAKFVCGKSDGKIVAPGVYFTAVNVHNPTYTAIRFRAKIAVALPGLKPGPVSKFFDADLGPDQALEIDCPDIFKYAETKDKFLKGFVVIECDVELDIVAVYTAAGKDGQVETLHTERVPARRIKLGLPDLIPVPDKNGSFCRRKDPSLIVTVKNQGTGWAGPSVTEVDFFTFGKVPMATPPLAPGASVDLLFPIPPGCFNPDCEFRITVDANNQVIESNEGNNIAKGICLG